MNRKEQKFIARHLINTVYNRWCETAHHIDWADPDKKIPEYYGVTYGEKFKDDIEDLIYTSGRNPIVWLIMHCSNLDGLNSDTDKLVDIWEEIEESE